MNNNEFITCEIFLDGVSYGLATWCPHCNKGFDNDDEKTKCPHCGATIKTKENDQ